MISGKKLRHIFRIDAKNGRIYWKNPPKNHPKLKGMEAGSPKKRTGRDNFYWVIKIDGRAYGRAHLIFFFATGRWPKPMVDHKDGNSINDRRNNLRAADRFQNAWNHKKKKKTSDLPMGVRQRSTGNFEARIGYMNRHIYIGVFPTVSTAMHAYRAKRQELFGEYA